MPKRVTTIKCRIQDDFVDLLIYIYIPGYIDNLKPQDCKKCSIIHINISNGLKNTFYKPEVSEFIIYLFVTSTTYIFCLWVPKYDGIAMLTFLLLKENKRYLLIPGGGGGGLGGYGFFEKQRLFSQVWKI